MTNRRPTPNQILARSAGTTLAAAVARILATFDRATPSDIESGTRWYGDDSAALLSDLARVGNVSRETAAAVVAQLSPRTTWARNVAAATALLTAYGQGGPDDRAQTAYDAARTVGAMGANINRALVALTAYADGADPIATVKGPKTNAFARNLTGDRDAVTVDVWAARVALTDGWQRGQDTEVAVETVLSRAGVYGAVSEAYRRAAAARGVDATTMQAVTWVVARNGRAA